jgi:glyoxalase family protein
MPDGNLSYGECPSKQAGGSSDRPGGGITMKGVNGLHHITAIAGPAQENLDFYSGVLGLRLVKKSVNQDDVATYHLFYADSEGHPGTDLTFFPWHHAAPARQGHGLASEVALAVAPNTLEWWKARLERFGVRAPRMETRFDERALAFADPHGLEVALVESPGALDRPFAAWAEGPVPIERQILGLHGARMPERTLDATAEFLTGVLGFRHVGSDGPWHRYASGTSGSGTHVDLREAADSPRGFWGVGSVHHLAWRVDDAAHQLEVRTQVAAVGRRPTPVIDRFWFQSVYFQEPGGVLFELATDGPGFAVDEDPEHLGETLVLPPWLEERRGEIEAGLPKLTEPKPTEAAR